MSWWGKVQVIVEDKTLKKQFTIEPIWIVPDLDKKMRIEVDVSDYAIERVLLIEYSTSW